MDGATVLAALSAYRAHIGSRNHRAFSALVPDIQAAEPDDPDLFDSSEELEEARLEFAKRLVGGDGNTEPQITDPSDILTHWDVLAPQLALDGGSVHHNTAWRQEMRDRYMRGVVRGLRERCSDAVTTWEFPADLAIILQHLDSLEGPGWWMHRDQGERVIFLEGWGTHDTGPDDLAEQRAAARVRTAAEILNQTVFETVFEDGHEIAGGWACGEKGNEAVCFAMYCRPRGTAEEHDWSWFYVTSLGQSGTLVFPSVVELLDWYKSYGEPTEEDWSVSAEEVFQP
ncbi:hypothetical protein G7054_g5002 [Neopestalotiopsis clavispora]|nr:hypothetical protein G7054_g5002 [Neopestalotiopsis clavispora]